MKTSPAPTLAIALLAAALLPAPAWASDSVEYFTRSHAAALPQILSTDDRGWYGSWFDAVAAKNWDRVELLLVQRPDGPLHDAALAAYYLHPESPTASLQRIEAWLARYRDVPQVEALVRLGQTRGLVEAPPVRGARQLVSQPYLSKRVRPSSTDDGTLPADIRTAILDHITNDDPDGARLLLDGIDAGLSPQMRAEWRQRVAWSYYIENMDAPAFALAQTVRDNGSGPWVAQADWVAGLAAWRLGDCEQAGEAFRRAAAMSQNVELTAASHYWANRAFVRCRAPEQADEQLRGAARFPETLYGMLAHEQLGKALPATHAAPDLTDADWRQIGDAPAVRQAVMLAEVGRRDDADEALRWLVRTGEARDYAAIGRLSRAMGLASTQTFLAYNAPRGTAAHPSLRFPVAAQAPRGGWQIDPALAFAHALQESNFRESVVSPADAVGLMQIRPIAAREYASSIGLSANANLKDPATNLAFGQRALAALARDSATRGALPKVMAAYNAGSTPVGRWNTEVRDQGDPLLWMESIPYWETRGYVAIVMRNYWMYLRQAQAAVPSRVDLAENQWPQFPGK